MPKYVPPAGGPTAKLIMRGTVGAGEAYGVVVDEDQEHCRGGHLAGAGSAVKTPVSTTLAANRLTTLEFVVVNANRQGCLVRWTFTPSAGKSYLVSGRLVSNSCAARLMDASDPDDIKVEATAFRRTAPGVACVPLSQARLVSTSPASVEPSGGEAVLRNDASTDDLKGLMAP